MESGEVVVTDPSSLQTDRWTGVGRCSRKRSQSRGGITRRGIGYFVGGRWGDCLKEGASWFLILCTSAWQSHGCGVTPLVCFRVIVDIMKIIKWRILALLAAIIRVFQKIKYHNRNIQFYLKKLDYTLIIKMILLLF